MPMLSTALDAEIGEIDEEEVRQGVHKLGGVWSRVVILGEKSC